MLKPVKYTKRKGTQSRGREQNSLLPLVFEG